MLKLSKKTQNRVLLGIYKIGQTVGKLATTFVLNNIIWSPITAITSISVINFEFHLNRKFTRLFLDNVEWQELNSQFRRGRTPWTRSWCLHRGCTGRSFRQCSTQRSSVLQHFTNSSAELLWIEVKFWGFQTYGFNLQFPAPSLIMKIPVIQYLVGAPTTGPKFHG